MIGSGGAKPPPVTPGFSPRPEPWRIEPAPAPVPRRPRRQTIWAVAVLTVGFAIPLARVVDVGALAHAHPAPRVLGAPLVDRILFMAFPDLPVALADTVRTDIAARYGIPIAIEISPPLDPAAWNRQRRQFGAEAAIDAMQAESSSLGGRRVLVIGLTSRDVYIESADWNWAFALRRGGAALVSSARMHRPLELDGGRALLRKMVVREMGFLAWGLIPTDDPGDLMYRDVLSLHDLVTMADDL